AFLRRCPLMGWPGRAPAHRRSLEFSFITPKRLFQQYRHLTDVAVLANVRFAPEAAVTAIASRAVHTSDAPGAFDLRRFRPGDRTPRKYTHPQNGKILNGDM